MELAQLEAFERAAREGSFTRAAEVLGLTQPAVSARISSLEAELGGAVFERGGRRLELTPLGARFLPYARRMLAVLADGLQEAASFRAGKLGEVRIAAPGPFVLSLLIDALDAFRQQHPTVDVLIRERNKTTIYDMLRDHAMTLGLVNAPVSERAFLPLARFQDPIRAVAAPSHPLAQLHAERGYLTLDAVTRHTIFRVSMFPHMTAVMDNVVEQARAGSGGAVIKVPMVMAQELVLRGQGVTFLPESYIREPVAVGKLTVLDIRDMPPLMSRPVLIALRDRTLDDMQLEFARILKACWRPLLVGEKE
jgi:DNA-binding transcriptional LysR family regulator